MLGKGERTQQTRERSYEEVVTTSLKVITITAASLRLYDKIRNRKHSENVRYARKKDR